MRTVKPVGNCNIPILFTWSSVNKQLKHNTSTIKEKVIVEISCCALKQVFKKGSGSQETLTHEKWGRLPDENQKRSKKRRVPDVHHF